MRVQFRPRCRGCGARPAVQTQGRTRMRRTPESLFATAAARSCGPVLGPAASTNVFLPEVPPCQPIYVSPLVRELVRLESAPRDEAPF